MGTPQTIHQTCHLFLEGSLFNADLSQGKSQSHPDDVRLLWAELNGRNRFPLIVLGEELATRVYGPIPT